MNKRIGETPPAPGETSISPRDLPPPTGELMFAGVKSPASNLPGLIQQLKQRTTQRRTQWSQGFSLVVSSDLQRKQTVEQGLATAAAAKLGPLISSYGNLKLHSTALVKGTTVYPLSDQVSAEPIEEGGTTSAQGAVFLTQQDTRRAYLVIKSPDWYLQVDGPKGTTASSQLSISTANFVYRQEIKSLWKFASAVNEAAHKSEAARKRAAARTAAASNVAIQAISSTDQTQQHATTLKDTKVQLKFQALVDLERAEFLYPVSALRPSYWVLRSLVKKLRSDLKLYETPNSPVRPPSRRAQAEKDAVSRLNALKEEARRDAEPTKPPKAHKSKKTEQSSDPIAAIEKLGSLRDQGVLTQEEFEAKKADLLDRL